MMAEAAMAAVDLDAFGLRPILLDAALPGADAVGTREDRSGRYRRRLAERTGGVRFVGAPAAGVLVHAPRIGRAKCDMLSIALIC
jgi:hypothetical protein